MHVYEKLALKNRQIDQISSFVWLKVHQQNIILDFKGRWIGNFTITLRQRRADAMNETFQEASFWKA